MMSEHSELVPGGTLLARTVAAIAPADPAAMADAAALQARLTKPRGALGVLEDLGARLCGITRRVPPPIPEPAAVAVFAADHGVVSRGVTPWPQEVTAQMVGNLVAGGAAINVLARQVGATVTVVDVGVATPLLPAPGLLLRKVRRGTHDLSRGPAMLPDDALASVEVGIDVARTLIGGGAGLLVTGDMGIGNTTAAAAVIGAMTGAPATEVTGRGTGIDDDTLTRKTAIVARAVDRLPPDPSPLGVLAEVGGLEIGALAGFVLAAGAARVPVVVDGVIALAGTLIARGVAPEVIDHVVAGHRSVEPGASVALAHLGLHPLLDLDLRLGEGTGACLAVPLVQAAARVLGEMATFDAAGVTDKEPPG
jgi:nicotinate-nucleotide--dimethylbenzimidazole phosphoribosyltransferase